MGVEKERETLESIRLIAGGFMARGHCGFDYDEISEELATTLRELSLIRRKAERALNA